MKKFLINVAWFSIPFWIIIGLYLATDPFKVLRTYSSFYQSGKENPIGLNGDYVALETFRQHREKVDYDTYIFGNSRGDFYYTDTLCKIVNGSHAYHFNVSSETLYGFYTKLKYLDKTGAKIKNCLLLTDYQILAKTENGEDAVYMKDPEVAETSKLKFQLTAFTQMMNGKFLLAYIDYLMFGKIRNYMVKEELMDDKIFDYNEVANEKLYNANERKILADPEKYYKEKKDVFFERPDSVVFENAVITKEGEEMLKEIKAIFEKHQTRYSIVVNPVYYQKYLNRKDLAVLYTIFGQDKVYNLTGINSITADKHNYFESSHYRPHISTKIMHIAFDKNGREMLEGLYEGKYLEPAK